MFIHDNSPTDCDMLNTVNPSLIPKYCLSLDFNSLYILCEDTLGVQLVSRWLEGSLFVKQ